jgi:hypothetical protein
MDVSGLGLTEFITGQGGGQYSHPFHMFKIKNDEILQGNKGITDPADFQIVEILGDYTGLAWDVDGEDHNMLYLLGLTRKPEFWKADTIINSSFGPTPDSSQWVYVNKGMLVLLGLQWPANQQMVAEGIGSHQINPVTVYKSTVESLDYIVSDGYKTPQTIIGVVTNTTSEDLMDAIIQQDTAQGLTVIDGVTGAELALTDIVTDQDTLVVISADSANITKYALTVSDGSGYTVATDATTGTVSGIPFGTTIEAVLANLEKPSTSLWNVIDGDDNLIPLSVINFDTLQVETKANQMMYIEVVAQNSKDIIVYSLEFDVSASDAFLGSEMFLVDEVGMGVSLIPSGIRAEVLLSFLYTNEGATISLIDKIGNGRTMGVVAYDDQIVVTSQDGNTVNVFNLNFFIEVLSDEAYLTSTILTIDPIGFVIEDVEENNTIDDLLGMLSHAPGAIVTVLDADGNQVLSGNVEEGYQIKVISESGLFEVLYNITIEIVESSRNRDVEGINVYPNPTSGEMFIVGLRENCTVRVINLSGMIVKEIDSKDIASGKISIADQPDGNYFVTIKSDNYHLKTIQVVKQ